MNILKYKKTPAIIASMEPTIVDGKGNWTAEQWYTESTAIPKWWNGECHVMKQKLRSPMVKFCMRCNKPIPESGCIHNISITNK